MGNFVCKWFNEGIEAPPPPCLKNKTFYYYFRYVAHFITSTTSTTNHICLFANTVAIKAVTI